MVDLIPIGTVNRPSNENNASKPAENVQQTAGSKQLADQDKPAEIERRRSGNRRRNHTDRRLLNRVSRKRLPDRRRTPDRRAARRTDLTPASKRKPLTRKGRIIDEEV